MPPGPPGIPGEGMTAASGTATTRANPETWGSQNSTAHHQPRKRASPATPDHRLTAAHVKDALPGAGHAGQPCGLVLDPSTRSHEPAAVQGKHNQRGSYPTPARTHRPAKPQVIPHLTPARFFRDDRIP